MKIETQIHFPRGKKAKKGNKQTKKEFIKKQVG